MAATKSTSKLLLITGIPGTGKTDIGNYLQKNHSFKHLEIENILATNRFGPDWFGKVEQIISESRSKNQNLVITWGFLPAQDHQKVMYLRKLGMVLIWFDGDKQAARRNFSRLGTEPEAEFEKALGRISSFGVTSFLRPIEYNPFDQLGNFKKRSLICENLLSLFSS